MKKIEMMAWQGNPYMMYAYARLHDVLQYDNHSDSIKHDFYKLAASHGIGDAYAQLAYMQKDGDLGECDYDAYNDLMQKALDHHSEKAMQQHIRDIIYGSHTSPNGLWGLHSRKMLHCLTLAAKSSKSTCQRPFFIHINQNKSLGHILNQRVNFILFKL